MKNLNWKLLLFLFMLPCFGFAQKTITGKVTESDGDSPIPGANVVIKGTSNGTVTDMDGTYSITAPQGETLVFSFMGFIPKEVIVGQGSTINVSMETSDIGIEEVIAVGYSSKQKTEISSAVVNISDKELQTATSHDIGTMLQGKVAGLQVMSDQQNVGSGANIRIRGSSSISANSEPLWVVDGIIGGSYDPQDVETITVLKDAGATGLYGSRGAGGVIVVTTKRGKAGDTKIRVSSKTGIVQPNWGNFELMEGPDFYDMIKKGFILAGKTESDFLQQFPAEVRDVNYDWQGFMYGDGMVTSNNISISGGDDKTTFYLSGNYNHEDGILRNDVYDRGSTTLNFTHKIKDKLSLQLNTYASYVMNQQTPSFTVYPVPFDTPYDANGNVREQAWVKNNYYTQERINHALPEALGNFSNNGTLVLNPSLKLDYTPTKWMTISASSRINYMSAGLDRYDANGSPTTDIGGEIINSQATTTDLLSNVIARMYKSFGEHSLSGLVGGEFNEIKYKMFEAHGSGLSGNSTVLDAAATPYAVSGVETATTYNSFFTQMDYNYMSKYFFTGSYRIDGSSRFGVNNRYGQFWSLAGSWLMSEEGFIQDLGIFDLLKFRASYGLTGNAGLDDYVHLNTFTLDASYMGENAMTALTFGNDNLTWEVARTFDVGLDAAILDNRINLTLDYYYTKNSDLLFSVPLPAEFGYSEQWQNIGQLDNWGYELAINAIPVKTKDFKWNFDFQIGYNKSEIKSLPDEAIDEDGDGFYDNSIIFQQNALGENLRIYEEGGSRSVIYGREWYGADPQTGDPRWVKEYDSNGAPVLTDDISQAQFITAKASPDFMGGISNSFEYKGISLESVISFGFGDFTVERAAALDNDGEGLYRNQQILEGVDRWEEPGDVSSHTPWVYQNSNQSSSMSSRYWENGNYAKLASISLGYTFNRNQLSRLGISTLKIFARGENLKIWHNSNTVSPELIGFDADMPLRDVRPTSTKIVFGIDLTL